MDKKEPNCNNYDDTNKEIIKHRTFIFRLIEKYFNYQEDRNKIIDNKINSIIQTISIIYTIEIAFITLIFTNNDIILPFYVISLYVLSIFFLSIALLNLIDTLKFRKFSQVPHPDYLLQSAEIQEKYMITLENLIGDYHDASINNEDTITNKAKKGNIGLFFIKLSFVCLFISLLLSIAFIYKGI